MRRGGRSCRSVGIVRVKGSAPNMQFLTPGRFASFYHLYIVEPCNFIDSISSTFDRPKCGMLHKVLGHSTRPNLEDSTPKQNRS